MGPNTVTAILIPQDDTERQPKPLLPRMCSSVVVTEDAANAILDKLRSLSPKYVFYPLPGENDNVQGCRGVLCSLVGAIRLEKKEWRTYTGEVYPNTVRTFNVRFVLQGLCRGERVTDDNGVATIRLRILEDQDFRSDRTSGQKWRDFLFLWESVKTTCSTIDKNINWRVSGLVAKCGNTTDCGHLGAVADIIVSNLFVARDNMLLEMAKIPSGISRFQRMQEAISTMVANYNKINKSDLTDVDKPYLLLREDSFKDVAKNSPTGISEKSEVERDGLVCALCGNLVPKRRFASYRTADFCYVCNSVMPGSNLGCVENASFRYFLKAAVLEKKTKKNTQGRGTFICLRKSTKKPVDLERALVQLVDPKCGLAGWVSVKDLKLVSRQIKDLEGKLKPIARLLSSSRAAIEDQCPAECFKTRHLWYKLV